MADSEDRDLTGETEGGDVSSGEPNTEEQNQQELTVQAQPAPKALTDFDLEEIQKDDRVSRLIQSIKDKTAASVQKSMREEAERNAELLRKQREEEELQRLIESEDYDAIGRKQATQYRRDTDARQRAIEFNQIIQKAIVERPEVRELGDEVIQEVVQQVSSYNGTIVDLMFELDKRRSEKLLAAERQRVRDELSAELEAKFTEYGLKKREEAVSQGEDTNKEISSGGGGNITKPKTLNEMRQAYIDGDITYQEYKTFEESKKK